MTAAKHTKKLAIDGGQAVHPQPFPPWPQFDRRADRQVLDILHSGKVNYWTGSVGRRFEAAFAQWLGTKNAVSVANGTAALHTALTALEIGAGDEVLCTSCSFIATSFSVLQAGAIPVFVDVGRDFLIDPKKLEQAITKRTKAILVVHLFGMVAEMAPILKVARKHGLFVIEDCAQCLGGVYKGRKAGTLGTIGCFSFCQAKHFTTGGEGGMVVCNDDRLAWEMRAIRDHGYDVKAKLELARTKTERPAAHYRVGYNFRMTEIQSAIGLVELARFDRWNLPRRRLLGQVLIQGLKDHPLVKYLPVDTEARQNSFWLVPFVLDPTKLKVPVAQFIAAVKAEGAAAYAVFWPETYREKAYLRQRGFGAQDYPFKNPANRQVDYSQVFCPVAHELNESTIAFWTHPTYRLADIKADLKAFRKVAAAYMQH